MRKAATTSRSTRRPIDSSDETEPPNSEFRPGAEIGGQAHPGRGRRQENFLARSADEFRRAAAGHFWRELRCRIPARRELVNASLKRSDSDRESNLKGVRNERTGEAGDACFRPGPQRPIMFLMFVLDPGFAGFYEDSASARGASAHCTASVVMRLVERSTSIASAPRRGPIASRFFAPLLMLRGPNFDRSQYVARTPNSALA